MKKRFAEFLAVIIMWLVFYPGAILAGAAIPIVGLFYAMTGNEWARKFCGFKGKSFDQVVNTYYLKGHPKETVSSHCGRWYLSGRPVPTWAKVVKFVTNVAEKQHELKAIEEPFKDQPLEM